MTRPSFPRAAFRLASMVVAAGCAPVTSVDERGRVVQRLFGYVEVVVPPRLSTDDTLRVEGFRVVGLNLQDGAALGYSATSRVLVPMDCRAVIIVKTEDQLRQVRDLFSSMGDRRDLCATVTPE